MIDRREFLRNLGGVAITAGRATPWTIDLASAAESPGRKPPFRVLYSNDLTNLTSCVSPFHKKGEPFREEMLTASIDEVAGRGIDVHLLQPGLGWVPWWPSKVYPAAEHYRWLKETYGLGPDTFGRYVMAGGDVVRVFIGGCRRSGQSPFISLRLNDAHSKEWADARPGDKIAGGASQGLTRFYCEHPEYRIGPKLGSATQQVQNWAIPAVREHKFAFLQELCENYDLDGLELDFMRYPSFFQLDKTSRDERATIMTGFVGQVRALLDRTVRQRRRWLCARVPCYASVFDAIGLDLPALVRTGLDMVNLSASYFTVQQTDLAAVRKLVPDAAVYLEMCHSLWNGEKLASAYDSFPFRRTTPEEYYTTAHLAYAQGADGVSLFNFAYYREHGGPGRGAFQEPPLEVIPHLGDRAWMARQPQHFFLAPGWQRNYSKEVVLPRDVRPGESATFQIDLAPPTGGWRRGGRLRMQTAAALGDSSWSARLNGHALAPTPDVSEPYPNPYSTMLGEPEQLRAWTVPAEVLAAGENRVEFTLRSGGAEVRLVFVDLAVS